MGTLAVEIEKTKSELFEEEKSLLADKELASKSTGSCATPASESEERQRDRAKSRGTTRRTAGHEELHRRHGDQSIESEKRERWNARTRMAQSTSSLRTQSGEVLRSCLRDRGEKRKFVNKSDGEQTMKALKDATAKTQEGVAKLDKNHEHSPGMPKRARTLLHSRRRGWIAKPITRSRDAAKAGEAATLERQDATEVVSLLWLAPSYVEHKATGQEGVNKFHLCTPSVRNTRSITQMMQTNWNVKDSSRNRKHMSWS